MAKYSKNYSLINDNGRVRQDRIDAYLNSIKDIEYKALAKAEIETAIAEVRELRALGQSSGLSLTTRRLNSRLASLKIEKALINTGYTDEELLREVGLFNNPNGADLLYDPENWKKSIFINPLTGKHFEFVFGYTGTVLRSL